MQTGPQLLLSVCVPTFNRGELLDVCLASLIPQAERFLGEVECIICDNASTDRTAEIIANYVGSFACVRAFRNEENIGGLANGTKCASELALGTYVLMVGDDDVLCDGAIEAILDKLRSSDRPDMVSLNVSFLPPEQRPTPDTVRGGDRAVGSKTLRVVGEDRQLPFVDSFDGPCADYTAMYSVVIPREYWRKEFPSACREPSFSSVKTTYAHSFTIAMNMVGKSVALIGKPLVNIYELPGSEFSWARYRAIVSLIRLTELLDLYQAQGVPSKVLRPYYLYQLNNRGAELGELIWDKKSEGGWRDSFYFAWLLRKHPIGLIKAFLVAMDHPAAPFFLRWIPRTLIRLLHLLKRNHAQ